MKTEELLEAARICTSEKNCMGCPMLPKFQSGEYCIDRLIAGLVDELEKVKLVSWHKIKDANGKAIAGHEMPSDGQVILIATKDGLVREDICRMIGKFFMLEYNLDWRGVVAWAEMPKYEVEL